MASQDASVPTAGKIPAAAAGSGEDGKSAATVPSAGAANAANKQGAASATASTAPAQQQQGGGGGGEAVHRQQQQHQQHSQRRKGRANASANNNNNNNNNNSANNNASGGGMTADLTARRAVLLRSLSSQLEYYFSSANLSTDTYLRTLMNLNSGYVPSNVVSNFANVNRIVVQGDPDSSILANEVGGMPGLINEAAKLSDLLEVATLDGEGKVSDAAAAAAATPKDDNVDKAEQRGGESSSAGAGSESGRAKVNRVLTLTAVGPKGGLLPPGVGEMDIIKRTGNSSKGGGGAMPPTPPTVHKSSPLTSHKTATKQPAAVEPERSTVILRDTPAATTEDDIRSVFASLVESSNCPPVHGVRPDVGNTWFVTLEPSSRDELVSVLLALRGKTVRGEAVKARLKTESVSARSLAATAAPPAHAHAHSYSPYSAPQSPVPSGPNAMVNPYQQQQQTGAAGMQGHGGGGGQGTGGGGKKAHQRGNAGPGAFKQQQQQQGDRPSSKQQSRSVPSSPMGGENGYGKGGKKLISGKGRGAGGGKGNDLGKGSSGAGGDSSGGTDTAGGSSSGANGGNKGKAAKVAAPAQAQASGIPPPPLVDLHFPSLGGDAAENKKQGSAPERPQTSAPPRYKAAIVGGDSKSAGSAAAPPPEKAANVPPPQHPVAPASASASAPAPAYVAKVSDARGAPESSVEAKKPVGGYAAALLKPPSSDPSSGRISPASIPKKKKELKLPPSTGGMGPSSKNSASATTITDDSSADDKSSVSSKTESIGTPLAMAAPAWGGGKTFADILKKKQESRETGDK